MNLPAQKIIKNN